MLFRTILPVLLLCSVRLALAQTEAPTAAPSRLEGEVTGNVAWIWSDELDLVGTMSADVVYGGTFFLSLDARTAIERTLTGLTFAVQSLDYRLETGARFPIVLDADGGSLTVFAGQRGRENVDTSGEPFVRYLGVGFDSPSSRRFAWSAAAGAVLDDVEVDADAILRASGRFSLVRSREGRSIVEVEAGAEALATSHAIDVDWYAGARVRIERSGETSLFARYVSEETPVGLGTEGAMVGLDFSGSTEHGGEKRPARVSGTIAGGAGEGRGAGRFALAFATPDLVGPLFVAAEVDGNILTAGTTGELYYFVHAGIERPFGAVLGALDWYHRSNHTLAEPNPVGITSYDVLEVGIDTPGFRSAELPAVGRFGRLEGRARVGYVLDTSFDESTSWHARGAVRYFLPWRTRTVVPFALAEADTGDVERRLYGLGARIGPGLDLQVEYREDEAYYGSDDTAVLFMAGVVF